MLLVCCCLPFCASVQLDVNTSFIHALDGTDYLPGLVGLNNIKHTDWLNVLVQALNFIPSFRNFFIVDKSGEAASAAPAQKKAIGAGASAAKAAAASAGHAAAASSSAAATPAASSAVTVSRPAELALKYGELLAKIWNPRSFKGHVSPHELLQAISSLSGKRFQIGKFYDCLQVLGWILNELHRELGGTKKKGSSIVHQTFQGEIKITTTIMGEEGAAADAKMEDGSSAAATTTTVEHRPFLYLSLALPAAPLFQDSTDRAIIPQIPLFELLRKFDGETVESVIDPVTKREIRRTYSITRLPKYLILHYQRFHENNWFWEKNPTLVNFPLQSLDMAPYTSGADTTDLRSEEAVRKLSVADIKKKLAAKRIACESVVEKDELVKLLVQAPAAAAPSTRYDLISNIVHEGVGGAAAKELRGSYKCHTLHRASNTWYLTEDLHVHTSETMPQLVSLSESYIQIYERQKA